MLKLRVYLHECVFLLVRHCLSNTSDVHTDRQRVLRNGVRLRLLLLQHDDARPVVSELLRLPADQDRQRGIQRLLLMRNYMPGSDWRDWHVPSVRPELHEHLHFPEPDATAVLLRRHYRGADHGSFGPLRLLLRCQCLRDSLLAVHHREALQRDMCQLHSAKRCTDLLHPAVPALLERCRGRKNVQHRVRTIRRG